MSAKKDAAPAPGTQEQRNLNWTVYVLPKDCRSLFVCMNGEIFDRWVKNGVIPLHDDRDGRSSAPLPCFIGYAATTDPKHLDILAGVRGAKSDEVLLICHPGQSDGETPSQEPYSGQE